MESPDKSRFEPAVRNALGEYIGATLAVIIALILLVASVKLVGMLALGPIGAFWFGVLATLLIFGFLAWTAMWGLFVAHFATLSRFM
jgi:hypothetical protein